jgi:hypothetical protein
VLLKGIVALRRKSGLTGAHIRFVDMPKYGFLPSLPGGGNERDYEIF